METTKENKEREVNLDVLLNASEEEWQRFLASL